MRHHDMDDLDEGIGILSQPEKQGPSSSEH